MKHFLTIEDGKLFNYPDIAGDQRVEVTDEAQLLALLNESPWIACSSSIDFPAEYTSDANVLRLVALIGGLR